MPLRELVHVEQTTTEKSIYHKNLMPVTYVIGDVAGVIESPVYAILKMNKALAKLDTREFGGDGTPLQIFNAVQPFTEAKPAMKWDGEWHITIEVFRDLGTAFAAVLVLIYVLMVGWFRSFLTPLVVMVAIPFSLVGILPAHGLLGAFFTATSMIGFMAGAGIVVRNSIILVDFIEQRLARRHAARRSRRRCRRGAFPPDAPDRDGGRGRRERHPGRPDFPRPRDRVDGRRNRLAPHQPHGRAGPLFHGKQNVRRKAGSCFAGAIRAKLPGTARRTTIIAGVSCRGHACDCLANVTPADQLAAWFEACEIGPR